MDGFALIADERRALADLADGLTDAQLATASLCEGWTVKDVVAHLAGTLTGTLWGFAGALVLGRFSFARANTRMTRAAARAPIGELTATLRERADDHFVPPGMDWTAPLTDTMVHREDVAVPLGLPSDRPVDSWRYALDFLVSGRARRGFVRGPLPGVRLVATDLDWTHGDGVQVSGPASALALAVSGRTAGLEHLTGPGVEPLAAWVTRP
jgi:uncharacterized protein (TIGR03083 family)